MTPTEEELIEASGFKPHAVHKTRQDILAALVRAIDKMPEDDYDNLSDEAADWCLKATAALNNRKEVPDFAMNGPDDEDVEAADTDADGDEADDDGSTDDDGDDDEDAPEDEGDPEEGDAEEQDHGAEAEAEAENEEVEAKKAARAAKKATKQAKEAQLQLELKNFKPKKVSGVEISAETAMAEKLAGDRTAIKVAINKRKQMKIDAARKKAKEQRKALQRADKPDLRKIPTRYKNLDPTKRNRYGVVLGTKTDEALQMFEKGASQPEVSKKLYGRHYNILRLLAARGHRVEKTDEGVFTLTHKDDIAKTPQKKGTTLLPDNLPTLQEKKRKK